MLQPEDSMNGKQKRDYQRAKRQGLAPSLNLRRHFFALARQVKLWADSREIPAVTLGVTSLERRVGKSTVSFNLASAMKSLIREPVLLIESDFGRSHVARRLEHGNPLGFSDMLLGELSGQGGVHETPLGLKVMGSGRIPEKKAVELPFDLVRPILSERFADYGFIVFDMPIASELTSCFSLAPHLDGVILTIEAGNMDQRQINRFRKRMEHFGVEIVGVVINKS
jgi:Mrp family chromosome partitioning ATPase